MGCQILAARSAEDTRSLRAQGSRRGSAASFRLLAGPCLAAVALAVEALGLHASRCACAKSILSQSGLGTLD